MALPPELELITQRATQVEVGLIKTSASTGAVHDTLRQRLGSLLSSVLTTIPKNSKSQLARQPAKFKLPK
jgi:hypothetical protein